MYLGQCLQMQSNIQDGMKVCFELIVGVLFWQLLTYKDRSRSLQTVQIDRAFVFEFIPIISPDVQRPISPEGYHDRHR